jgi:hypothetical protein
MKFPTRRGRLGLETRDSRTASAIGKYWNAVGRYLASGDASDLRAFRGNSIKVGRVSYPFVTDPDSVERMVEGQEYSFDSTYERTSAS